MGFTHYPKLESNQFLSALWYGPEDPRNNIARPLVSNEGVVLYGVSQNFTRFYGTVYSDQPLTVTFAFSNEEYVLVDPSNQISVSSEDDCIRDAIIKPAGDPPWRFDKRLPDRVKYAFPVSASGMREITDEDLPNIPYDGIAQVINYVPPTDGKPAVGDKFLVTIYGSILRVRVLNTGGASASKLRVIVRASVF